MNNNNVTLEDYRDYCKFYAHLDTEDGAVACQRCPLQGLQAEQKINSCMIDDETSDRDIQVIETEIKRWKSECKISRAESFLKMFPNADTVDGRLGALNICPNQLDVNYDCPDTLCKECKIKFWTQITISQQPFWQTK